MSATASAVLQGLNLLNINPLQPTTAYAILDATAGTVLVTPDTCRSLEYKGEYRICDYPIEQGGFSSYNKIALPYDLRLVLCCAGGDLVQQLASGLLADADSYINSLINTNFSQPMSRSAFILACEQLLASLTLVDVVTPDRTYESLNCIHFGYNKTKATGAGMVIADLWFREVRQSVSANYTSTGAPSINSNTPDAADTTSAGAVTTAVPTAAQAAILNSATFV